MKCAKNEIAFHISSRYSRVQSARTSGEEGQAVQTTESANAEATSHERATRERLILDYLPLVRSVARDFVRDGTEFDDLVQVGTIGLINAVDRFEPERGVNLAAFARPTVAGEIQRHLRDTVPAVRPPRRLHELNGTLRRLQRELSGRLGRPVSISELAEAAGTSTAEAGAASELDTNPTVPIEDLPVAASDPFDESDARLFVASCLDTLDGRDRRILELRFYGDLSQREIARAMGLSQIHVSRLIERSLRTIQCRATGWASFEDCGTTAKLIH